MKWQDVQLAMLPVVWLSTLARQRERERRRGGTWVSYLMVTA